MSWSRSSAREGGGGRSTAASRQSATGTREQIRTRFPDIPRRVSGYNLPDLLPENGFNVARALVGTECTCAIVLEAKCRLVDSPPQRTLVLLGYDDIYLAADDVPVAPRVQAHRTGRRGRSTGQACQSQEPQSERHRPASERQGVAARRVRRRARARKPMASAQRLVDAVKKRGNHVRPAVLRRRAATATGLGRPRVGTRRDRVCAQQAADLGRVGGLRRLARQARRLSARPASPVQEIRLHGRSIRPFRPGLCAHAQRLRPGDRGRDRANTAPTWTRRRTSA